MKANLRGIEMLMEASINTTRCQRLVSDYEVLAVVEKELPGVFTSSWNGLDHSSDHDPQGDSGPTRTFCGCRTWRRFRVPPVTSTGWNSNAFFGICYSSDIS